jgi:hypothetical protein
MILAASAAAVLQKILPLGGRTCAVVHQLCVGADLAR